MSVFDVISLLGGLAMFLFGMRLMSSTMKENSSGALKRVLEKVTDNPLKAFLLGIVVTAIMQSSTATIVITSGLVAAGVLTLDQSLGIIIGSNVGTTITGQIIRLLDLNSSSVEFLQFFKPATLASVALIIGIVLIMGFKTKKIGTAGYIAIGFGVLFSGLMNMTNAVSVFTESGLFEKMFEGLGDNPFLGYLVGLAVSFVLQSSSASVAILQAFSVAGTIPFKSLYAIILGIYLGDCLTTAIVCSIGTKAESKRVGMVNLIFNLSSTVLIIVAVNLIHSFGLMDAFWTTPMTSGGIANTNTIFKLGCSILLLPLVRVFARFSRWIIREKPVPAEKYAEQLDSLNPVFFSTPALAFQSCLTALKTMFYASRSNIAKSISLIKNYDEEKYKEIIEEEDRIDRFADHISTYLGELSRHITLESHMRILVEYNKLTIEFEHLGDYAEDISNTVKALHDGGNALSDTAIEEIRVVRDLVGDILTHTSQAFEKIDVSAAQKIEPLESVMSKIADSLHENHVQRLHKGECSMVSGTGFLDLLTFFQRISGACSNIGMAIITRLSPEISTHSHSYINELHRGNNPQYNAIYNEEYLRYAGRLQQLVQPGEKEVPAPENNG